MQWLIAQVLGYAAHAISPESRRLFEDLGLVLTCLSAAAIMRWRSLQLVTRARADAIAEQNRAREKFLSELRQELKLLRKIQLNGHAPSGDERK